MVRPPRLARLLLKLALDGRFREEGPEGLDRDFEKFSAEGRVRYAAWWYRYQVARSLVPLLWWRLTRGEAAWRRVVRSVASSAPGQDAKYALRSLVGSPGFSLVIVLTFALGIGANTAVFSLVHSLVIEPLPFPEGERVVQLWRYEEDARGNRSLVPPVQPMVAAWQTSKETFDAVGGYAEEEFRLSLGGDVSSVRGARVSPEILSMVSARPLLGRLFDALHGQAGQEGAVILSEDTWTSRFGSDPGIVGRRIVVDGSPHTVVGVLPRATGELLEAGFFGSQRKQILLPLTVAAAGGWEGNPYVVARLAPGVTVEAAQRRLDEIQPRVAPLIQGHSVWYPLVRSARDALAPNLRRGLWVVFGAVAAVLLIACANIATLLLVRRLGRESEMRIRLALGAGRSRLVGQLLTESLLIGTAGILLAALSAKWLVSAAVWIAGGAVPAIRAARLDPEALGFALLIGVLTIVGFSLIPILQLGRLTPADVVARRRPRPRRRPVGWTAHKSLVVTQVALATLLVLSAGLLSNSFGRLMSVDTGIDTDHLAAVRLELPGDRYDVDVERIAFFDQIVEGLNGRAGVEAAGWARFVPPRVGGAMGTIHVEGVPSDDDLRPEPHAGNWVSPSYFEAVGSTFLSGRPFTDAEIADRARVVILNQSGARRLWPDGSGGVGSRIRLGSDSGLSPWMTVVGIVPDIKAWWLGDNPNRIQVYLPVSDIPPPSGVILVRSGRELGEVVSLVQHEVSRLDAGLPVGESFWVRDAFRQTVARQRFQTLLLSSFGLVGLLLAMLGVYGVLSLSVTRRSREIGVRLALGATRGSVVRSVVVQGLAAVGLGTVLGLVLSWFTGGLLSGLLWGIDPTDLPTYVACAGTIVVAGLGATWISTRRAMGIDPVDALKRE